MNSLVYVSTEQKRERNDFLAIKTTLCSQRLKEVFRNFRFLSASRTSCLRLKNDVVQIICFNFFLSFVFPPISGGFQPIHVSLNAQILACKLQLKGLDEGLWASFVENECLRLDFWAVSKSDNWTLTVCNF